MAAFRLLFRPLHARVIFCHRAPAGALNTLNPPFIPRLAVAAFKVPITDGDPLAATVAHAGVFVTCHNQHPSMRSCPGSSLLRNIIPLFFSVIENFYIIYFLLLYYIIVTYIAILYLFLSFFSCFEQLCNLLFVYFSIFPPFFVFTYSLFTKSFFFILLFYFLRNYDSNRHAVLSSGCSGRTMQEY